MIDDEKFPIFRQTFTSYDVSKLTRKLGILNSSSRKMYTMRMSEYLNSCRDFNRDWKEIESVKCYLENIFEEHIFSPSSLWSINSMIGTLHIELLGMSPLKEDKSLLSMLKGWTNKWNPAKAKVHEM